MLRWKLQNVEEIIGHEESMGQYQGGNDDSSNTEQLESIDANYKKQEELARIEKERLNLLAWKLKSEEESIAGSDEDISSRPTSNSNEASNSPCASFNEAVAFFRETRALTQAHYSHTTAHAQSNTIDLPLSPYGAYDTTELNLGSPSTFNNQEHLVNTSALEHASRCTDKWSSFAASSNTAECRHSMPTVVSSKNRYQQQNSSSSLFPSQYFGEMVYGNRSDPVHQPPTEEIRCDFGIDPDQHETITKKSRKNSSLY
jgi:hypothetical protein